MYGTWIDRTKEYAARNRGEDPSRELLESHYTLELAPLPCWRGKPAKLWRRYVREMIEEIEREGREARTAAALQGKCLAPTPARLGLLGRPAPGAPDRGAG